MATLTFGNAVKPMDAPARETEFNLLINEQQVVNERLGNAADRLNRALIRLRGAVPENAQKDGPTPVPSGNIATMQVAQTRTAILLTFVEESVADLEKYV